MFELLLQTKTSCIEIQLDDNWLAWAEVVAVQQKTVISNMLSCICNDLAVHTYLRNINQFVDLC